jgi:hypothetical protein
MKKLIIIFIILLSSIFIYMSIHVNNNNNYQKELIKEIKDNYKIKENINNAYKYDNYTIFTTKNNIYVLDINYNLILKDKNIKIKDKEQIIYKNNQLMILKTKLKDNKLIYNYYDLDNKLIKKVEMEI